MDPSVRFRVFSRAAVAAFGDSTDSNKQVIKLVDLARRTWEAYAAVGRQVGSTPVDSIALRAMLNASAEGQVLEMEWVHRLLLIIKMKSLMTDAVSFAAGSALETMFVRIKSNFLERILGVSDELEKEWRL